VPDTGQFLPDTALLGRVADKRITVAEFVETYFNSYAPDRPKSDSAGRVEWLQSMVNKEVLARVARGVNYQPDFAERVTMRAYQQRVLANVLYLRQVSDSVRVSDAEIADLYEKTKFEYHIQRVMCAARSTADTVYRELQAGHLRWRDAVRRYSVARDSSPDGDVGWVNLISMSADMTFGIIALKPGGITRPVGDREGWHLIKLIGTRPTAPIHESVLRRSLANKVRLRHEGERIERLNDRLRERAGLVYDEPNILWASRHFKPTRSTEDEGGVMSIHFNTRLPVFPASDTGRVVARYKDGQLSLSRFVYELGQISGVKRPSVDTPEAFKDQIDTIILEGYRAQFAREMGLDRDPVAVEQMAKRLEQMQVEHLSQDSIEARVQTTPEEARRYYEAKPAGFTTYPRTRYAVFVAPSKAGADSIVERLKAHPNVEEMVAKAPTVNGLKMAAIREEGDQDHGTYHTVLFEELKPGQSYVDGPDVKGQFAIIHLMSFDPGHLLSFAEARGYAEDAVRAQKAEEMLKRFIERHSRGVAITTHPELVGRVRMMDPASSGRD
jgi:peptidyl-prolyl cis-trans isomerase C